MTSLLLPRSAPEALRKGSASGAEPKVSAQAFLPDSYADPALPPGVVWIDADGLVVNLSASACRLIGPIIDDYVGQSLASLIAISGDLPDAGRQSRQRVPAFSIMGRPLILSELGRMHTSRNATRCGLETDGTVRAIVISDGVPQQQMAEQLAAAERLTALGRLTEEHAHAIANPLSAVLAVGAVLEHSGLSDLERSRLVRQLIAEAHRASARVAQLLSAAHAAHGEAAPVEIGSLIVSTANLKAPALQAAGISLVTEVSDQSLWASVQALALEQALLLALDAIGDRRTRSGHGSQNGRTSLGVARLTVGPGEMPDGSPAVAVDVSLPPHWRRANDRLALSRALALVRSQGGVIKRGRNSGFWRRVTCLFPLVKAPNERARQPKGVARDKHMTIVRLPSAVEERLQRVERTPVRAGLGLAAFPARGMAGAHQSSAKDNRKSVPEVLGLRALVVDDEAVYRSATARLLRIHGASLVIESATGREALAVIDEDPNVCDVILLDMRMPGLTGAEVYHALRQRAPSLARRTLFMVGERVEGQLAQFFTDHALPFVAKPYEPPTLLEMLNELRARPDESPGEAVRDRESAV